jgi:triacylglycerol lipase
MTAKLLRHAIFLSLAIGLSIAMGLHLAGHTVGAIVFLSIWNSGWMVGLAVQFVLMWRANRSDSVPRANAWQLSKAWWEETGWALRVFGWWQPFLWDREPDFLPPARFAEDAAPTQGVVLVHGLLCNRGFWLRWLHKLRAENIPCIAINLEPTWASIDLHTDRLDSAIKKMEALYSTPPLIVAHSMGGLVVRTWLQQYSADDRVGEVITIATPHRGTEIAQWGARINLRQMRRDSDWLTKLALNETPQRLKKFTCYYGQCDNAVFPASCGTLPGANNIHVPNRAHVAMAFDPDVMKDIFSLVRNRP